jgi:hypothetical protein
MAFAVEEIPDTANLFRKIHASQYNREMGKVSSAAFKDPEMSVNWEKYRTAIASTDQNSVAVVALVAKDCRELNQTVKHTPIEAGQLFGPNQAHAEVLGKKTQATSQKLRDKAKTVWLKESK